MDDSELIDDDLQDGCDLDFTEDPTPDEESDLFVLFAEAVDETNPKTAEVVAAEWKAVFDEGA